MRDDDAGGPTLDEFLTIYEADDNEWWRASCGQHQDWFEEAVDRWRAVDIVRWMVHGYRWCPSYKNIYEWDESQVQGCLWCSEWSDEDHPRLGVLASVASTPPPEAP